MAIVLSTTILGTALTAPGPVALAAEGELEEILVTARRKQESLQDVPISITVFDQQALDERNVISAADLVKYTPSLNVNTRFGSDQASFAIRGFTQEFRTTASVGVYFADVVAPRGGAVITAGDGAGPGAFFDLKNVQVLKGPQGTLFGRNTTGGAILLVPQEPTSEFEGYGEVSAGNEDMQRVQGVINVPISDRVRVRLGLDTMQRDGYMENVSGIGPGHLADIDYVAGRASLVVDVTDTVQNYAILSYANSENNGTLQGLFVCNPNGLLDALCQPTLASQKDDYYAVASDTPNPTSKLEQWQAINTTTWEVNDALTVKNIISYADLEQTMRTSSFGTNFKIPAMYAPILPTPDLVGAPISFYPATTWHGTPTSSQTTFVEELQFSGTALDEKLTWQGGLYYENSRPDGWSGTLSYVFLTCTQPPGGSDPASWQCQDVFGQGFAQSNLGEIEYTNMAAYSQGTYDISDQLSLTLGLRYTVDDTQGKNEQITYKGFPRPTPGGANAEECVLGPDSATLPDCRQHLNHNSDAPTWLIDLDYLPTPDLMLYAKYTRGYRQGSINMFAPEGVQTYEPEEVDAFELGSKWSFEAPLAGTLNVALFYNELTDQQLQYGYEGGGRSATTAIVNAGSSTIQGAEIETTLQLYMDLVFSLSYTYLDTELDKITEPQLVPPYTDIQEPTTEGSELTFSPENTVVMSLNYRLPLPADVGDVKIGTSYTFIDNQLSIYGTYGMLDSRKLLNLNASWTSVMGSNFDASLFATNVTDEEYPVNVTGFYDNPNVGMDFRVTGEPRMYGARLRYNFR
jgi:iron complex outermembrane receptor protein